MDDLSFVRGFVSIGGCRVGFNCVGVFGVNIVSRCCASGSLSCGVVVCS